MSNLAESLGGAEVRRPSWAETLGPESYETCLRLFEDNIRLSYYLAERWKSSFPPSMWDELVSEAMLGLWKAAVTFNPHKGTRFGSYGSTCINNQLRMLYRTRKKDFGKEVSIHSELVSDGGGDSFSFEDFLGYEPDMVAQIECKEALESLSRQPILRMYYIDGLNQKQIAQIEGITQSYTSRKIRKAVARIRKDLFNRKVESQERVLH